MKFFKIVSVVLIAIALGGCSKILFVGDSITVIAGPTLKEEAQKAYYIGIVEARSNTKLHDMIAMTQDGLANDPDVYAVMVNGGTNDVGTDTTTWQDDYEAIINLIKDRHCVILTTVSRLSEFIDPPIVVHAADINTFIVNEVNSNPNFRLVDWDNAVQSHAEYTTDSIHPSQDGSDWLAKQYVAATQSCQAAEGN